MTTHLTRYRFTVDDYHLMGKVGIIPPDARTELLDGEVVQMPPIGPAHMSSVLRGQILFTNRFGDVSIVSVQNPIHTDNFGEPIPDITLLRPRSDLYAAGLPRVDDVFLVVEVGDTTADDDRRVKAPLYARAGVPELWLHDIGADTLTVCREPGPDGYQSVATLCRGDRVAPLAFPGRAIAVDDLLGELPQS